MQYSLDVMKEQNARILALEEKAEVLEAKVQIAPNYFSIMGYCAYRGIQIGLSEAKHFGKIATGICRRDGYTIDNIPDPRFGRVNTYPVQAMEEVFKNIKHKHRSVLAGKNVLIKSSVPKIGGKEILIKDWADRVESYLEFEGDILMGTIKKEVEYVKLSDLEF
jgi:hypothetical protein